MFSDSAATSSAHIATHKAASVPLWLAEKIRTDTGGVMAMIAGDYLLQEEAYIRGNSDSVVHDILFLVLVLQKESSICKNRPTYLADWRTGETGKVCAKDQ